MLSFNLAQIKRLSEIFADLGKAVVIGSTGAMFLPAIDRTVPVEVLFIGEFLGGVLIGLSVSLLKGVKDI